MNTKAIIAVLVVVCAGLAVALIASKMSNGGDANTGAAILQFSNELVTANDHVNDLQQVNLALTNSVAAGQRQVVALSNRLTQTSGALASARAKLQGAEDQIANLNGRVSDLETQNRVLDDRAAELTNTIATLNAQIAETEQKLADSETNNIFLERELQQQIAQRAELERKFDDINQLRAQVKKLRDEAFIARWMQLNHNGTETKKGAELLVNPRSAASVMAAARHGTHYNLNVEVGSDGSVHVIPPLTNAATNPPAH